MYMDNLRERLGWQLVLFAILFAVIYGVTSLMGCEVRKVDSPKNKEPTTTLVSASQTELLEEPETDVFSWRLEQVDWQSAAARKLVVIEQLQRLDKDLHLFETRTTREFRDTEYFKTLAQYHESRVHLLFLLQTEVERAEWEIKYK